MLIIVAVITAVILYMKVDSKDFPGFYLKNIIFINLIKVLNELMGSENNNNDDQEPVNSPIKTTELNTTDLVPLSWIHELKIWVYTFTWLKLILSPYLIIFVNP